MKVESIRHIGYTTLVDANGGEEQTIIITTRGQSGHVWMRVLHIACDDGHLAWGGTVEYDRKCIKPREAVQILLKALTRPVGPKYDRKDAVDICIEWWHHHKFSGEPFNGNGPLGPFRRLE